MKGKIIACICILSLGLGACQAEPKKTAGQNKAETGTEAGSRTMAEETGQVTEPSQSEGSSQSSPAEGKTDELTKEDLMADLEEFFKSLEENFSHYEALAEEVDFEKIKGEALEKIQGKEDWTLKEAADLFQATVDEIGSVGDLNIIKDQRELELAGQGIEMDEEGAVLSDPEVIAKYADLPGEEQGEENNFEAYEMEKSLAYIKLAAFEEQKMALEHRRIHELLQNKSIKKVILDLRGNDSENEAYWMELARLFIDQVKKVDGYLYLKNSPANQASFEAQGVEYISPEEEQSIFSQLPETYQGQISQALLLAVAPAEENFKGQVYILLDETVKGSAAAFSQFAQKTGMAKLIGPSLKADGLKRPPSYAALPNSGLVYSYAKSAQILPSGKLLFQEGIQPDVKAKDAMAKVLELVKTP